MSIKSNKKQKALALALAVSLNLSIFPCAIYAEEASQEAQSQTEDAITEEIPAPLPIAGDSETANDSDDNVPRKQTTSWDPANSQPCDEYTMCDPASVAQGGGQDWKDLLSIVAILLGDNGSGNSETAGATIAGDSTAIINTDPTTGNSVELPADFADIAPAGTGDTVFYNVPTGPDMSGIQLGLLGGIPLGPNASYTYRIQGPGSVAVEAFVYPLNPEIDSETKFAARVTSKNASVHVYPPAQYASETYTEGGDKTKTFKFQTIEYPAKKPPRYGSVTVTVNAKVYEGTTSLCSSDDASCDNGLQAGSEFDANGNVISTTGDGINNTGTSTVGDVVNNTGTSTTGGDGINTGTTGIDGTNTGTGTSTGDYFNTGTSGTSNSGLLDNLFNNTGTSSSNNGSSPDWLNDGFSSYNNENSSDNAVPADFGSQFAENGTGTGAGDGSDQFAMGGDGINGTGGINGVTGGTNGIDGDGGNGQFAYADENGTANGGASGNGSGTDVSGSSGGSSAVSDGALGGIFSKIDSAIGNDPAASNSLTNKFSNLINTADKTAKIMAEMTPAKRLPGATQDTFTAASNAELSEVARQMLAAYGTSQEDIKSGKLFDAGSAYTDPQDAWNLNRMSTVLKNKNLTVK